MHEGGATAPAPPAGACSTRSACPAQRTRKKRTPRGYRTGPPVLFCPGTFQALSIIRKSLFFWSFRERT